MFKVIFPYSEEMLVRELRVSGYFTDNVQKAMMQAKKSHAAHMAFGNRKFLEGHLWPVVHVFLQAIDEINASEREDALIASILHDSLEDDPMLTSTKLRAVFSERAVKWIGNLTRQANYDEATDEEKLRLAREFMKSFMNTDKPPRLIKLADRLVNQNLIVDSASDKPLTLNRYIIETEEMFLPLARNTSSNFLTEIGNALVKMKEVNKSLHQSAKTHSNYKPSRF